jgi:hypothetical protein
MKDITFRRKLVKGNTSAAPMTNPIFLLVLMLLSTFLVSKTVGSPSYSKDSSGLLDDVVGSSRRTHRPVASTSRPPKAKSWVVADANTYEEFLSMGNDHGEGFSQRNSGRMKYTRTFTIEERAGFSFPDESQKDSRIYLTFNKEKGQVPTCALISTRPGEAFFTYSLRHRNSGKIVEKKEIGPNSIHTVTWGEAGGGLLDWYIHYN